MVSPVERKFFSRQLWRTVISGTPPKGVLLPNPGGIYGARESFEIPGGVYGARESIETPGGVYREKVSREIPIWEEK